MGFKKERYLSVEVPDCKAKIDFMGLGKIEPQAILTLNERSLHVELIVGREGESEWRTVEAEIMLEEQ